MHDIDSIATFDRYFPDEHACIEALMRYKWPEGFRCSQCGHTTGYRLRSRKKPTFQCASCHYQESLIVGTLMEHSSTSLRKWFLALFYVGKGCSSKVLKDHLSVTYKTAWTIAAKIRRAISESDEKHPLTGHVLVSGALYNLQLFWIYGLHKKELPVIVGTAAPEPGADPVTIKVKLVDRDLVQEGTYQLREEALDDFVEQHTDEHHIQTNVKRSDRLAAYVRGYMGLKKHAMDAHASICRIFKGIGRKHLQSYLDEFCFRESAVRSGLSLFEALIKRCTLTKATPYNQITAYRRFW